MRKARLRLVPESHKPGCNDGCQHPVSRNIDSQMRYRIDTAHSGPDQSVSDVQTGASLGWVRREYCYWIAVRYDGPTFYRLPLTYNSKWEAADAIWDEYEGKMLLNEAFTLDEVTFN